MDAKLFLMVGCLAGIVSACMHEKSDSASDIQQAVHTLVLEADSLMQSDSLFGISQLTSRIRKYASMIHSSVRNWTVHWLYVLTSRLIC